MEPRDVLGELFGRIDEHVENLLDGLSTDDLCWCPNPKANSIGWLIWHLTRVEDHHVSELLGIDQVWASGAWAEGFGLEPDPDNTGYGHSAGQVATVRPSSTVVVSGYYRRVAERTREFIDDISASDLDRVVDERWDPPVTMGARLISVADDAIQHLGAAAYLKGLLPTL